MQGEIRESVFELLFISRAVTLTSGMLQNICAVRQISRYLILSLLKMNFAWYRMGLNERQSEIRKNILASGIFRSHKVGIKRE